MDYPNFCGVMLNFEKCRGALANRNEAIGNGEYYHVLGYYDNLTISEITSYDRFAPSEINKYDEKSDYKAAYERPANRYMIRATIPSCLKSKKIYTTDIFDYSIHRIEDVEHKEKPFLTAILLNFSYMAIREHGLNSLSNTIANITEKVANEYSSREETKQAFAIYDCLGSTDCIILCRSNNFSIVTDLLKAIRNETGLICVSYFIPTMAAFSSTEDKAAALKSIESNLTDMNNEFSIRATLRPGTLWHNLEEELKNFFDKHNIPERESEIPHTAYNVSGIPDLLLKLSGNPSVFYKLISHNDSPLSFFADNPTVLGTRTALMQPIGGNNLGQVADKYLVVRQKRENLLKNVLIETLQGHIELNPSHETRIYNGMLSLLHNYFELTEISGNFDVAFMIDRFIEGFIQTLKQSNRLCEVNPRLYNQSDNALNAFREDLSRVIDDFSKSNRNWLEGRLLTHQVLGSTKKIITAIYSLIKELDDVIRTQDAAEEGEFYYIITSGGVDAFQVTRYFEHIHDGIDRRLVVIHLPEKHLFKDLGMNTLFQVYHEYFHFASSDVRNKAQRKKCYLEMLSLYITEIIILRNKDYGIEKRIATALVQRNINVYDKGIIDFFRLCMDTIAKKIYSDIVYRALSDGIVNNDSIMYFNDILDKLKRALGIMLDPVDSDKRHKLLGKESYNEKSDDVLKDPILCQSDIIVKIVNYIVFSCNQIAQYSEATFEYRRDGLRKNIESELQKWCTETHKDEAFTRLKTHFLYDVQRLFEYVSGRIGSILIDDAIDPYKSADLLRDAFRESFADVCAIYVTDCTAREYIDIITADKPQKEEATNMGEILRLFLTLEICFTEEELNRALSAVSTSKQIKYGKWSIRYAQLRKLKITEPLKHYLNGCIDLLDNKLNRRGFTATQSLKATMIKNPTPEQESVFFDELYNLWDGIASNYCPFYVDENKLR